MISVYVVACLSTRERWYAKAVQIVWKQIAKLEKEIADEQKKVEREEKKIHDQRIKEEAEMQNATRKS